MNIHYKVYKTPGDKYYVKYRVLGFWVNWKSIETGTFYGTTRYFLSSEEAIAAFLQEMIPPVRPKDELVHSGCTQPRSKTPFKGRS